MLCRVPQIGGQRTRCQACRCLPARVRRLRGSEGTGACAPVSQVLPAASLHMIPRTVPCRFHWAGTCVHVLGTALLAHCTVPYSAHPHAGPASDLARRRAFREHRSAFGALFPHERSDAALDTDSDAAGLAFDRQAHPATMPLPSR